MSAEMLCEGLRRRKDPELVKSTGGAISRKKQRETDGISVRPNRGYMRSLLLHSHDNDRVYIEKLQATILSIDIRKKLAIRERLGGI